MASHLLDYNTNVVVARPSSGQMFDKKQQVKQE